MNLRVVAGVGLGFLVVPAIAGAQQETSDAERNWSAVAACGAIDNADRRLECVDRVLQQVRGELARGPKPRRRTLTRG